MDLQSARNELEKIRLSFLQELEMARKLRVETEKNQRDIIARAQSQAQLLILQARMSVKKELAEDRRKNNGEMQKLLGDMRILRVTAEEELKAQHMFTDAARISSLELAFPAADGKDSRSEAETVGV